MRGQDGVWCREKRIVGRKRWFAVVYIDASAGDFSFFQKVSQSGVIDDAATGGIDEDGMRDNFSLFSR